MQAGIGLLGDYNEVMAADGRLDGSPSRSGAGVNAVLAEELESIVYPNSIRPTAELDVFTVAVPGSDIAFALRFPSDYPYAAPAVVSARNTAVRRIRESIASSHVGDVCLFALIDSVIRGLPVRSDRTADERTNCGDDAGSQDISRRDDDDQVGSGSCRSMNASGPLASTLSGQQHPSREVHQSDPIVDRKSVFIGRAVRVISEDECSAVVQQLLAEDKKMAKATHNVLAWRVRGDRDTIQQDYDDDGEDGAGSRVLHLLQILDLVDVLVIVSRWFGGIKLQADRFKHINNAARSALLAGLFIPSDIKLPKKGRLKHK